MRTATTTATAQARCVNNKGNGNDFAQELARVRRWLIDLLRWGPMRFYEVRRLAEGEAVSESVLLIAYDTMGGAVEDVEHYATERWSVPWAHYPLPRWKCAAYVRGVRR